MPETITPAALELKRRGRRRLIGGATIALLMVVFLPMIFDSEPRRDGSDKQEIALAVPAKEGLPPLPPPAPAARAPKVESAVAEPAKTAAVAAELHHPRKRKSNRNPQARSPSRDLHRRHRPRPSLKPGFRVQSRPSP